MGIHGNFVTIPQTFPTYKWSDRTSFLDGLNCYLYVTFTSDFYGLSVCERFKWGKKKKDLLPDWPKCFVFFSSLFQMFFFFFPPFPFLQWEWKHPCRDSLLVRMQAWNLATFALNSCPIPGEATLRWHTSKVPSLKVLSINGLKKNSMNFFII